MMSRQSDSIMVFDLDILERNISRRLKFWDVPLQDVVVLPLANLANLIKIGLLPEY